MISRRFAIRALALAAAGALLPGFPRVRAGAGEEPGDMVLGEVGAPVTLIEYVSLTCPHCRWFHENVYPKLKADYVETGKVRYVVRDFPLDWPAVQAAVLARCAGPDRYFAFIDVLFRTFDEWTRSADHLKQLTQIGELGGLSRERFEACLADKDIEDGIFRSIQEAQAEYDVSGTPTLIVDGGKYEGSLRFDALAEHLDRLLPGS